MLSGMKENLAGRSEMDVPAHVQRLKRRHSSEFEEAEEEGKESSDCREIPFECSFSRNRGRIGA